MNQNCDLIEKQIFYLKLLILIFISVCHKYFYMTKIIRARNVQAVCNKKFKPSSQIPDPSVRSWSWLLNREFQVFGFGW